MTERERGKSPQPLHSSRVLLLELRGLRPLCPIRHSRPAGAYKVGPRRSSILGSLSGGGGGRDYVPRPCRMATPTVRWEATPPPEIFDLPVLRSCGECRRMAMPTLLDDTIFYSANLAALAATSSTSPTK